MKHQVLIPCAGTGSRLFEETKYINKALVHLNNKPIITHILEKFSKECQFIIAVGYKSKDLIDYLSIAHSDLDIIIEEIDKYDGPNSSLGYSLSKTLKHINQPFIFTSCDTLVKDKIPFPDRDWIGYSKIEDSSNYATINFDDNVTKSLNKKLESDSKNAYIGLAGINDYKLFKSLAKDNPKKFFEEAECYPISKNISSYKPFEFSWFDTGNIPSLNETRRNFTKKKLYNILEKEEEKIWFTEDKVIKFSNNTEFIKNRVQRAEFLDSFIPQIIDVKDNMYSYKFVEGEVLSSKVNLDLFEKLLNKLKKFWEVKALTKSQKNNFQQLCYEFYKDKTFARVEKFISMYPYSDKDIKLNDKFVNSPYSNLDKIDWSYLSNGVAVNFHGDLHFENIILTKKNEFVFLDWRQSFNSELKYGDIYYDLSKLLHGILLPHSIVSKGEYTITESEQSVETKINIPDENKKIAAYFEQWCNENNFDFKKVKLICSLIYLNIASLHHHPYSKFLFYYGVEMLSDEIE
jgi:choline kinase/thiamine kinase-like enzyme